MRPVGSTPCTTFSCGYGWRAESRRVRIRKSSTLRRSGSPGAGCGGRLLGLADQAVHAGLHLRPRHLAALHRQQLLTPVAHVHREHARAQQVAGAGQEAEQVHGVFPARGAVGADVGVQLAALTVGDGGTARASGAERGEDRGPRGTGTRRAATAARGRVASAYSTSGECRHSRTLGLPRSASSQNRSSSQLNCSSAGPSTCVGGFSKAQNREWAPGTRPGGRCRWTPWPDRTHGSP